MSRPFLLFFVLVVLLALAAKLPRYYFSAKPECVEDPAFGGLAPGSPAYEERVRAILRESAPADFRYFFKTFDTLGTETRLVVNMRNAAHCFDVPMLVEHWDKLAGMRRSNGRSYPEELYQLSWTLAGRNGMVEIIYVDMRAIID